MEEREMNTDLAYLTEQRDNVLDVLNHKIRDNLLTDEELHNALDRVLRVNKQVKTIQDTIVTKEKK